MSALFKLIRDDKTGMLYATPANKVTPTEQTQYTPPKTGTPAAAPRPPSTPVTTSSSVPENPAPQLNDIVGTYDWSVSPKNDIIKQPYIYLKEYRISKSSLAAQVLYQTETTIETFSSQLKGNTESTLDEAGQGGLGPLSDFRRYQGLGGEGGMSFLEPYYDLYLRTPTTFQYKMPYFTTKRNIKTASWDANFSGTGVNAITEIPTAGIEFIASFGAGIPIFGALNEPGLYIERGKYYQPRHGADSIEFSFPLLNTLRKESIQKNFDLIWLLFFQNSSYRTTKANIQPPCLYEVLIPGITYMMYAFISNITVEYLGTRRRISLKNPGSGKSIDTIVPEAYNVKITINSMTTDSGNLMLNCFKDSL